MTYFPKTVLVQLYDEARKVGIVEHVSKNSTSKFCATNFVRNIKETYCSTSANDQSL